MADEQDTLLRQIDEELRRERLSALWDKYGVLTLGVIAVLVAAFGGWRLYQSNAKMMAQRTGAQFTEANTLLTSGKDADAIRGFEKIAKDGGAGYAVLAKLQLAADARKKGRMADALKYYGEVAGDNSADSLLKNFARLQIASLKVDTASWTEMQNQLNDLVQETSPWRHSARELLGLAAYKARKFSEARKAYQGLLTSSDVSQSIRQRAQIAMALITREELKTSAGTAAKTKPAVKNGAAKPGDAKTK